MIWRPTPAVTGLEFRPVTPGPLNVPPAGVAVSATAVVLLQTVVGGANVIATSGLTVMRSSLVLWHTPSIYSVGKGIATNQGRSGRKLIPAT